MGLLLQELYISAELMLPKRWDVLASALQWADQNWEQLEDMRFGMSLKQSPPQKTALHNSSLPNTFGAPS